MAPRVPAALQAPSAGDGPEHRGKSSVLGVQQGQRTQRVKAACRGAYARLVCQGCMVM